MAGIPALLRADVTVVCVNKGAQRGLRSQNLLSLQAATGRLWPEAGSLSLLTLGSQGIGWPRTRGQWFLEQGSQGNGQRSLLPSPVKELIHSSSLLQVAASLTCLPGPLPAVPAESHASGTEEQVPGAWEMLPSTHGDQGSQGCSGCCLPTPTSGSTPPGSPTAGAGQNPQGAAATSSPVAGTSCPRSKAHARRQALQCRNSSQASTSAKPAPPDPLTKKAGVLIHFLLQKFKMKQPIRKIDMLKLFHKRFKTCFPEILSRAAECMELAFGLDLKEVKPNGHSYTLVSKLGLTNDVVLSNSWGLLKNGLLMPLLSVIFLNGNGASEADVWEFLNILGIYDGKQPVFFEDPRKLITEELVQQNYLVYRQIPNSNPLSYEFLWGPRAHAETKMKVLEFLAKTDSTIPSAFPFHYAEGLREEEERSRGRSLVRSHPAAKANQPRVPPRNPSSA